jgi:hypothetical protein
MTDTNPVTYWHAKAGTSGKPLEATLENDDGTPINLTGCTVRIRWTRQGAPATAYKVDQAATIDAAPATGIVRYTPTATDTDTVGTYDADFKVTTAGGTVFYVPDDTDNPFFEVRITDPRPSLI